MSDKFRLTKGSSPNSRIGGASQHATTDTHTGFICSVHHGNRHLLALIDESWPWTRSVLIESVPKL